MLIRSSNLKIKGINNIKSSGLTQIVIENALYLASYLKFTLACNNSSQHFLVGCPKPCAMPWSF
jgi:hypothetical protein